MHQYAIDGPLKALKIQKKREKQGFLPWSGEKNQNGEEDKHTLWKLT